MNLPQYNLQINKNQQYHALGCDVWLRQKDNSCDK